MSLVKYSCPKCTAKCRNIKKGAHELALGPAMSPSFSIPQSLRSCIIFGHYDLIYRSNISLKLTELFAFQNYHFKNTLYEHTLDKNEISFLAIL